MFFPLIVSLGLASGRYSERMAKAARPVHPEFLVHLERKERGLIELFLDARQFLIDLHPEANELLYRTHALTAVFSVSERLSDAYCMLPIYTNHLNLGFNKGTLIEDPHRLLTGTGNLIRHLDVSKPADYRNQKVRELVRSAIEFAKTDRDKPAKLVGATISKLGPAK